LKIFLCFGKIEKNIKKVKIMSDIIVAGAGHGGLASAALLAKAGHSVTVYEKNKKEDLGHDWEDRFTFSVLTEILGISEKQLPDDIWCYRGDCAFVSPSKRKKIIINYTSENRQRIMLRKPLIKMLVDYAGKAGVKFSFETEIIAPLINKNRVEGILTDKGKVFADLVIDAAGVYSPLRANLPKYFNIENAPKNGDVFYAYRAYFNKTENITPEAPFEVYLYHEGEKGLSWFYTADNHIDVLIGRIYPLSDEKIKEQLEIFKTDHPWLGDKILSGGNRGVIPVRRPLPVMVADGYAAVGDSAFMTTPMNGMGIDLSLNAGRLLADTVIKAKTDEYTANVLWEYNRDFHIMYGGDTAKNEGLKNSLLTLPGKGVDFLFENDVIQSSDLAGAGKNTNIGALLGKFTRGMKNPSYFFTIINGLLKGAKTSALYKAPPMSYDLDEILKWKNHIEENDISIN